MVYEQVSCSTVTPFAPSSYTDGAKITADHLTTLLTSPQKLLRVKRRSVPSPAPVLLAQCSPAVVDSLFFHRQSQHSAQDLCTECVPSWSVCLLGSIMVFTPSPFSDANKTHFWSLQGKHLWKSKKKKKPNITVSVILGIEFITRDSVNVSFISCFLLPD